MDYKILGQVGIIGGADTLGIVQYDRQMFTGGFGDMNIETDIGMQNIRPGMNLAAGLDLLDGQLQFVDPQFKDIFFLFKMIDDKSRYLGSSSSSQAAAHTVIKILDLVHQYFKTGQDKKSGI